MKDWIIINPNDNVAVALIDLSVGYTVQPEAGESFLLTDAIPKGHKFCLADLPLNADVIKYGSSIGHVTQSLSAGSWIHSHNLKTNLTDAVGYQFKPENIVAKVAAKADEVSVYRRANGQVGIRNEIWVIPTVGCVNGIARQIVDEFLAEQRCDDIDGVFYFPHQFGCSQLGDDHQLTKTLLQNMAKHPNAGGVLVIGLGCENNQISEFRQGLGDFDEERIKFLISQEEDDEVDSGVQCLQDIYKTVRQDKRQAGKLAEINFGLECGGSDGFSGITANPLIGQFSDYVINQGGTTVLTEVPEMFGAEKLLMSRCQSEQTFQQVVQLIESFKQYYHDHNQPIYENPSPGNKKGGITTLEEKSLGCTQKSGTRAVVSVLDYGELITQPGLALLNAPGNDAIATSALAASGCHIVLFSTGRGTPYGGYVPTFKIATNRDLALKKPRWIDFDAGGLTLDQSMSDLLVHFISELIDTVNGKKTRNEINNIREIAIWKKGVTL